MEENQKDMPAVQETQEAPQSEFVPSPKWKRVLSWMLYYCCFRILSSC